MTLNTAELQKLSPEALVAFYQQWLKERRTRKSDRAN